ncbi:MAG TPA: STAS/SEC14 domain-containing protein [Myxococcales bacterium]|nr:STAS/SEC14 domain-containing protein [Myxococcales bacterium]
MPYEISTFELPDGRRCARLDWLDTVTGEDADAALAQCEPGGSVHGLPVLALGHRMTDMSPEARAIFSGPRRESFKEKMALVIANPLLRVMANFVLRIRRSNLQRLFRTEAEAIAWLLEKSR